MQSATHIDGIRHAPASRTANVVRSDTVKVDSLSQSMHLMGAMMAYSPNSEIFGENEPADSSTRLSAAVSVLTKS